MPPASRVSHVPRHSAFRFAVPIGAALAGLCGASLWAQTTPAPPSGLRQTFDDNAQDAPWKKKARPRQPPPGTIPKFGNAPGWGAGSTGFNSPNARIRRSRARDTAPGATGPDATSREPVAKAAAKPPGLPPPPPPPARNASRTGKPRPAVVAQPPRPASAGQLSAGVHPPRPDQRRLQPRPGAVGRVAAGLSEIDHTAVNRATVI